MNSDVPTPSQIEAMMEASAALIGLTLDPQYRPGVLTYFTLAARMAQVVQAVPLCPLDETGALFRPVESGAHDEPR